MEEKLKLNFTSSWDDGGYNDHSLVSLLISYKLKGVFFIPSCTVLSDEEVKQIGNHFELGGHTVTHPPDLKRLDQKSLRKELVENRGWLQELTGQEVTKFCYPRGRYNQDVIDEVREAGYLTARTTLVGYFAGDEAYRQHTTAQVFQRNEYAGMHWLRYAKDAALRCAGTDGTFHLWGHSDEIKEIGEWDNMVDFFGWLQRNFIINNK